MRFTVHAADGTTIALVADLLDAQRINRETPRAHHVRRVADGALMASKAKRSRAPSAPNKGMS